MSIQLLDDDTINKIAAGEVIERPASVVKELTENAVDAGATSVTIEIRDGGRTLIRVTDNGCGIPKEEVREAFLRHATSKIRRAEDLREVQTLGFRGEALSSIAAVCRTEIITKTSASLTGTRLVIEGGEEKLFEEIGAPEGTTVIARDLFFRTPVRRKFLKAPATEAAHIAEAAEQQALARPALSFRLIVNGQTRFATGGSGRLKDLVYQLYGRETAKACLETAAADQIFRLEGLIGKPEISRGSRSLEHFIVNGRYVRSNVLSKAVEEGYGTRLMQHMFPFCVLHFTLPPELLDVNVHPAKREVRFSDSEAVYRFLRDAVAESLSGAELIRDIGPESESAVNPGPGQGKSPAGLSGLETKRPAEPFETRREHLELNLPEGSSPVQEMPEYPRQLSALPESAGYEPVPASGMQVQEPKTEYGAETSGQLALFAPEHREQVRLAGEVFDTYWIAEWNGSMYIIDQHAAHEKVNFERLMARWKTQQVTSQTLFPPRIITLTEREAVLVEDQKELFSGLGFEIEHFGGREYAVRAVPDILPSVMKEELLKEMIGSLTEETDSSLPRMIIEKTASMSCKAAVKGNQRLNRSEAEHLLSELFSLEDPYHCPHGRPAVIRMSRTELERRFKRIL